MIFALHRAIEELFTPALRRVVALSFAIACASLALLWVGAAILLHDTTLFASRLLDLSAHLLGMFGIILLIWLLFPAVLTIVMSFFVERIAAAVEALDYPGRNPPRRQPITEVVMMTVRLMGLAVVLNLLALPLYLVAPGINLLVFLTLNGYLLGRGYFEVVAIRRLDMMAARAVRQRFGGRVFLGGVVIAALFALPVVNLVAPVIATAFMLHIFEGLPRVEAAGLVS